MKKTLRPHASFGMALWSLSTPLTAQQPVAPQGPPTIVVSAQGQTRYTPDRAAIYFGVRTEAPTAAQAASANARKQKAVIDTLHAMGVPNELISTASFSVSPRYGTQPEKGDRTPHAVAYEVSNTVRVDVRTIVQVGLVIDAALEKGANEVGSLQFSASNADELRRTAFADAVTRARGDAEAIAKAAGGRLGDLLEVTASGGSYPQPILMRRSSEMGASVSTPINPGEEAMTVQIMTKWSLSTGAK